MAKPPRPPRLTESVAKRIRKAGYSVQRGGNCLICGKWWSDCPHSVNQVITLITALKTAESLGIPLPT